MKNIFRKEKPKFPILAVIVLILSGIWFFSDLGYITIDIPWIPIILIVIAIGIIANRYR